MARGKRAGPSLKLRNEEHLPAAELDVLACLWRRGTATAREVREALHRYRPMAHGSVATLLGRLQDKGLVSREKGPVGKAFIYKPARRAGTGYRRVLKELLQRVFGGDSLALVTSLFETQPPTQEELQELQQLLDDLRGREDR